MISKEVLRIQLDCVSVGGCRISLEGWAEGLVVKLLEMKYWQWLCGNVAVHNLAGGLEEVQRKQELQIEIERQIELGVRG